MSELTFDHALGVTDVEGDLWHRGDAGRAFPLASVSKMIAALAVLVAVAEQRLRLEDPAGPDGATIRHLLAHTAGYTFDGPRDELKGAPGERRIYSNTGFDVLGDAVADAVGLSMEDWVRRAVVEPLELAETDVSGSPAKDYHGSARDLLAVGRAWMQPRGTDGAGGLLPGALWREATAVQFPGLPGLLPGYGRQKPNDWGLGVEIRDTKSPHWTGENSAPETFGHFGQSGSFLWVDPTRRLAAAFVGSEPFGAAHQQAWPGITDQILRFMDRRGEGARARLAELGQLPDGAAQ